MAPKYSIVIRAYNEAQHIGRLLDGIMQQTLIEQTEIILVDSGSTDDTLKIAGQYPVKVVTISPEEFTFGRCCARRACQRSVRRGDFSESLIVQGINFQTNLRLV